MKQKKCVFFIVSILLSLILSIQVYAVGDGNLDGGGGSMGQGTSQNSWSPGNEGVRVTVIRAESHDPVTRPIDLTNKHPNIAYSFGKVSKMSYTRGVKYLGTYYDTYAAIDTEGRQWKFMSDGSITAQKKSNGRKINAGREYQTEMVSPICRYEDIVTIQEIIRKLKEHGALTNGSCGIHVHINAEPFDARTLRNITNIMAAKEDLIHKALGVSVDRQHRWCQPVDTRFLEELNRRKPKSMEAVERIWYNGESRRDQHYDDSRYHCLNLHSVFQKGTVEFRLFNGTLHAGKIKAYIQFCLAIGAQALNQSCASRRKTQTSNEKYTFRTWLLRLGLNGEEFATARQHLLANLPGCIAWKDPAQAEAQKERMRQKREKELAERIQRQETIHPIEELESAGEAQESPAFCMRM